MKQPDRSVNVHYKLKSTSLNENNFEANLKNSLPQTFNQKLSGEAFVREACIQATQNIDC